MKKILLVLLLIATLFVVSGCHSSVIDDEGNVRTLSFGLIEIRSLNNDTSSLTYICYDPSTKVCYLLNKMTSKGFISPYYIVNENGEAEIAIYGKNYQ